MKTPWLKRASQALIIGGVLLGIVVVRVVLSSRDELEQGRNFQTSGDIDSAIVRYRRAARWYAPGNPYSFDALERLAALGLHAERQGDTERALAAWRAVRGSIMATRSVYTPHPRELERANDHIATLMASLPPPPIDAGKSQEQLRAEHLVLLRAAPRPNVFWTLVLLVGFFAWLSGAFLFASRGFDAEDRVLRPQAYRFGAMIVVGFTLFVVGMLLA